MYQKRILPYFIIPSTFSPQTSSPLERYGWTEGRTTFFTPRYPSFFFPLSARDPTRRRNSTGLAELWGGWPIEQVGSVYNRVILNGQFGCGGGGAAAGRGAVEAWRRRGGHKGHASLKFEKDGSLAKCASGATKIDR